MMYKRGTPWRELAPGGIIPEAGTAEEYNAGSWRTFRPVRDDEKCIDCFFCWVYCPDNAIVPVDGHVEGSPYDLLHCKGCGLCAKVCPKDAITMVKETECED